MNANEHAADGVASGSVHPSASIGTLNHLLELCRDAQE